MHKSYIHDIKILYLTSVIQTDLSVNDNVDPTIIFNADSPYWKPQSCVCENTQPLSRFSARYFKFKESVRLSSRHIKASVDVD